MSKLNGMYPVFHPFMDDFSCVSFRELLYRFVCYYFPLGFAERDQHILISRNSRKFKRTTSTHGRMKIGVLENLWAELISFDALHLSFVLFQSALHNPYFCHQLGPNGWTDDRSRNRNRTDRTHLNDLHNNSHSESTKLGTDRQTACTNPLRSMMSCECAVKSK